VLAILWAVPVVLSAYLLSPLPKIIKKARDYRGSAAKKALERDDKKSSKEAKDEVSI
jgi:hypothetical protein